MAEYEASNGKSKTRWGSDPKIIRSKMIHVFQAMTGSGNNTSNSDGGTARTGKSGRKHGRWEHMVRVELENAQDQGTLTELVGILVEYCVGLLLHMREDLEMNTEVGRVSRAAKGSQDEHDVDDEHDLEYELAQRERLQRCGTLYAGVLFTNGALECNHSEDQRCFEKLYAFISKSVQACVKVALEDHDLWPKTGLHGRLRPSSIVNEELGRLFRSQGFNSANRNKARKRERVDFENQRREASDEANRFSLRPEEDAKEKPTEAMDDSNRQQKLSPIDAIVARYQTRRGRRVRPEGSERTRGAIRDAAGSRSPMISSLLPSPRQKMLEVDYVRAMMQGLTPRLQRGLHSPTSTTLSSTLPPVNSPRSNFLRSPKHEDRASTITNTWALSRERVAHQHKLGSSHLEIAAGPGRRTL